METFRYRLTQVELVNGRAAVLLLNAHSNYILHLHYYVWLIHYL